MLVGTEYWFILASYVVGIAGGVKYISDTITGKVKPNRVSWFFWAPAPSLGTYVAVSAGQIFLSRPECFYLDLCPCSFSFLVF